MSRISFPSPETMTDEQLKVYKAVISGPRGRMVGPLRAAMHNPELAAPWQQLGSVLRYKTSLPPNLNELAILVTARRWNSEVEWSIHKDEALKAGLDAEVIEAIGRGNSPVFTEFEAFNVYEFCRQLLLFGNTNDEVYQRVLNRWEEAGVVELTALVGYYSMVAMTLNVHKIPLPEGTDNELPQVSNKNLFEIPPAKEIRTVNGNASMQSE